MSERQPERTLAVHSRWGERAVPFMVFLAEVSKRSLQRLAHSFNRVVPADPIAILRDQDLRPPGLGGPACWPCVPRGGPPCRAAFADVLFHGLASPL